MFSFRELQKAKKLNVDGKEIRLAVLGNCASQFLSDAIEGYGKLEGINISVFDADYNQIDVQLLDPMSEVYSFHPDKILIWLGTEKLYEEFLRLNGSSRISFAEDYMLKIVQYWNLIKIHSEASILQMNLTEIDDKVLGQYSCKVDSTFTFQMRKLNYLIEEAQRKDSRVFPIDNLAVQIRLGKNSYFNSRLYYSAKMPIAMTALPYLAKSVIDVVKAMSGRIRKCIILDLDNTLWGGIIGDDGLSGIEIGELGKGHVFSNFQLWLKQLKEFGIILCVCSKNEEVIAKEPFEKHKEMVLRLEDISVFVANWDDKASNIKLIQDTLNIGMDSIIFIDDNPFERNLVREMIPEIEVPELPEDPADWLTFLQEKNYFDIAAYTEGSDRTKQYQAEYERKKLSQTYSSLDDYLKNLEMVGTANDFEPLQYPRIAQLTQRSNQFNLRTVRYTENDIQRISESDDYVTLYYTLRDKFGDHGLVGVVIMKKKTSEEVFIDTWLMSCRVLKRGMEEFIVNRFVKKAREKGFKFISAEYIPTVKNQMVKDIYEKIGFKKTGENKYWLNIDDYEELNNYIKGENQDGEK